MTNRLSKVRELVFGGGLADAVLISDPGNVFYISGFTGGTDGELLITLDAAYIITDSRYYIQAKKECPDFTLLGNKADIENISAELNIKTLGVEDGYISLKRYRTLEKSYNKAEIVGISDAIFGMRAVKDETEIRKIKEAVRISDLAFSNIVKEIRPGAVETDIALKLEYFMRCNGAKSTSFETIVASGARSAMPHGTASGKMIERGDFVVLDFGCIFEGYCSDMTRTVSMGMPSEKQMAVYQTVKEAQKRAEESIRPGVMAKDVDAAAREYITKAGFGEHFTHSTGHGVGIDIHEPMYAAQKSNDVLEKNTVITVEPGIYIEGEFGVRIEDLVVVTEDGPCILTKSAKDLIIL